MLLWLKKFLGKVRLQIYIETLVFFWFPTRMDTQGVSRDEAMCSGLVPITNKVAAVPEF